MRGLNRAVDLKPLSTLASLTDLHLGEALFTDGAGIADIEPLKVLRNLKSLELSCMNEVGDLSPIAELRELTRLDLFLMRGVDDLAPLAGLTNLMSVRIDPGCGESLPNLGPVARVPNLDARVT